MNQDTRKHPDLFTPQEAVEYLHLDPECGERTLTTFRQTHGLIGTAFGKVFLYHRKNLDALVERLCGLGEISGRRARR